MVDVVVKDVAASFAPPLLGGLSGGALGLASKRRGAGIWGAVLGAGVLFVAQKLMGTAVKKVVCPHCGGELDA